MQRVRRVALVEDDLVAPVAAPSRDRDEMPELGLRQVAEQLTAEHRKRSVTCVTLPVSRTRTRGRVGPASPSCGHERRRGTSTGGGRKMKRRTFRIRMWLIFAVATASLAVTSSASALRNAADQSGALVRAGARDLDPDQLRLVERRARRSRHRRRQLHRPGVFRPQSQPRLRRNVALTARACRRTRRGRHYASLLRCCSARSTARARPTPTAGRSSGQQRARLRRRGRRCRGSGRGRGDRGRRPCRAPRPPRA